MKKHIDITKKINKGETPSAEVQACIQTNEYFSETLHSLENLTQIILKSQNDLYLLMQKAEQEPQKGEDNVCVNCELRNTIFDLTQKIKEFEHDRTIRSMVFLINAQVIFSPHH